MMQTQVYNEFKYDYQNVLIYEREQEIRELLKQQQEINQIFKDIAILVEEQGEMVDNIRSNITSSNKEIKEADKHLEEAEKEQKHGIKLALGVLAAVVTTISATTLGVIFGT